MNSMFEQGPQQPADSHHPELPEHLRGLPRVGGMYSHADLSLRILSMRDPMGSHASALDQDAFDRLLKNLFDDLVASQSQHYEHFEGIGIGGLGVVIAAKERDIDKWVAFKVCQHQKDTDLGARFHDEAKRMVDLKGVRTRHIPEIHGHGVTQGGRPFFTMELVRGPTLLEVAHELHSSKQGPIDWRSGIARELIEHLADALGALHLAHNQGYVHRDFKPENLKLTQSLVASRQLREVMILDWGGLFGTPDYMSPEQARGDATLGPHSDIWSAGATLHYLLTGRTILPQGSMEAKLQTLRSLVSGAVVPSIDESEAPRILSAIVKRALQLDESKRYRSASEMAHDLRAFLEHGYVRAYAEERPPHRLAAYRTQVAFARSLLWVLSHSKLSAGLGITAVSGLSGFYLYHQHTEAQRIEAADNARRESDAAALKIRAQERLEMARENVERGELNEAVLAVSPDLTREMAKYPELFELSEEIERHRDDWQRLLSLKERMVRAYAGNINTFELAQSTTWSQEDLEEAAELFLPGGLTQSNLTALETRLSDSVYTGSQRQELGDRLIECFVLRLILEYPDVIHLRSTTHEARGHAIAVLDRVDQLEELGKICDGEGSADPARERIFLSLRATALTSLERMDELNDTIERFKAISDSRGATNFLSALIVPIPQTDDRAVLTARLNASASTFMTASMLDRQHFGAAYFAAQRFYALYQIVGANERHALAQNTCINLERCLSLDPDNVFLMVQLTVACQRFWAEERLKPLDERIAEYSALLGAATGNRALGILERRDISPPIDFLRCYGELCLDIRDFERAVSILNRASQIAPRDSRVAVRLACAQGKTGKTIDESLLPSLEGQDVRDPVDYIYTAAAYSLFLEQQPQKAGPYREIALQALERAVERASPLRERIWRLRDLYFRSLKDDPRFTALAN